MNNKETKQVIINAIFAVFIVSLIAGVEVKAQDTQIVVPSPTPTTELITVAQKEVVEPNTIEEYIKYKFGEHSNKAMLLLQGQGSGTCAENRNLDPKAVNDNRTWGGVGRDVNIFQINDFYHPVKVLNLENDWKANINYAYRMFENDNFTFVRWSCGKVYGI